MGDNTAVTVSITLASKKMTLSGRMSVRESVSVTLSPVAALPGDHADWKLYLLTDDDAVVASCLEFSEAGVGVLDLATTELQDLFEDGARRLLFNVALWDSGNDNLIGRDFWYIYDNPAPADDVSLTPAGSLPAGEAFDAHVPVSVNGDGKLAITDRASNASVASIVGLSASAAVEVDDPVTPINHGPVTDAAWAWTPGKVIYLDDDGGLTETAPESGSVVRIGVAMSATVILVDIQHVVFVTGPAGEQGEQGEQGIQGVQGLKGEKGDKGLTGAAGAVWRYGTAAPGDDLGANGDLYLDAESAKVYQKADGEYSEIANLAVGTDVVSAYVLGLISEAFASLSELEDPSFDDAVTALNAVIAKLKEVGT
jgi:hypothetical protein